jgi:membrane fusion protein (multidrug efflux system)
MPNNEETSVRKKVNWKVYIPLTIVVIAVLAGGFIWYQDYTKYISTDDAHIDGHKVAVSPKMMGRILKLYVEEGDSVKEGQLIVELDSADILAQREHAKALKVQAASSRSQAVAKYNYDVDNLKVLKINLERAQDDFKRAQEQYKRQVISTESFEHTKKTLEAIQAQYDAAQKQLDVSKAQIESAAASIQSSEKQIEVFTTQLLNTKIVAPMSGIVAKRWLLPGDIIQPGQPAVTIQDDKQLWVIVFIEETKLSEIHLNQEAKFNIDAFPDATFIGRIFQISSNTAGEFSLIPPNNASGNFTKITQRVPLKVSIDKTEDGKPLSNYKILSGMSVEIKIEKESN